MKYKKNIIGKSIPRLDAKEKVTGAALYTDDLNFPNMLHGALVRSVIPHGIIKKIDISKAKKLRGVRDIITGKDTPKIRYGNWRLFPSSQDELPLAIDKVRFVGDEIAAVAAENKELAKHAANLIKVEYEELPTINNVKEALQKNAPLIHEESKNNISITRKIEYGDLKENFKQASLILENTFKVQAVNHAYLEPCSSIAIPEENNRILLYTSTQTPYIVQCLLAQTLGIPENYIRVMKTKVGGGFGGKMELRSWEFCASLMALRTGRPIKFTLNRSEEFSYNRRRHPMEIHSKIGFDQKGKVLAKDLQITLDGGAYNAMGPTATFLCGTFGNMLYNLPAYKYYGRHVYTNNPPSSAMRGFGAPQAAFAGETQFNIAAEKLGIDPIEIRLKNAMESGDKIPEVATISSCGFKECLQKVKEISNWQKKYKKKDSNIGIGIGCFSFISGGVFNWFNTKYNFSAVEVKVFEDGTAQLATMACDIGQGSDTVLRQILSAELGISIENINLISMDTSTTPKADLGSWGSRVTLMNGNAIINAAKKIKKMLIPIMFNHFDLNQIHNVDFENNKIFVKNSPQKRMSFADCVYKALRGRQGKPLTARGYYTPRNKGLVSPAFSFGAQVAEIKVDKNTGLVKISNIYTAHDCGTVLNKKEVEGQLEGATQMGIGYTLSEQFIMKNGYTLNKSFMDYKIPTSEDMPPNIEHISIKTYEPEGPFGAKESGEGLAIPTAPAIAHAIFDATGFFFQELPITPEKLLKKIGNLK